ncbi:uncharacterized protein LOC129274671 [Lytechinus pictus]|uniref:uncharacterized protein LOC129274671 n=1 Tax=Lytechinus pictus TaxID=7653 RepID=UPI0030BA0032
MEPRDISEIYREKDSSEEKILTRPCSNLKDEDADGHTGTRPSTAWKLTASKLHDDRTPCAFKGDHTDADAKEGLDFGCCKRHDGQWKKFFCRDCDVFICASCVILEHEKQGHTWISASEAVGQIQREAEDILLKAEVKLDTVGDAITQLEKKIEEVPLHTQALKESVTAACDDAIKYFTQYLQSKRSLLLERIKTLEKSGIDNLESSRKEGLEIQAKLARITMSESKVIAERNPGDILKWKSNLEESLKAIQVQSWCKQNAHVKVGALDPELKFVKRTQETHQCWCHVGRLVQPGRWIMVRTVKVQRQLGDLVTAIATMKDGSVALGYQISGVCIVDPAGHQRHVFQDVGHVIDISVMSRHKLAMLDANGVIKVVDLSGQVTTNEFPQGSHHFKCLSASTEGALFTGSISENTIHILGGDQSRDILAMPMSPLKIAVSANHIAILHQPASITILDMDGIEQSVIREDQWAYASVCSSGMGDFFVLSADKSNPKSLKIGRYGFDGTMVETVISNYRISTLGWLNPRISASSGKIMVCIEDELITFEREMDTLE